MQVPEIEISYINHDQPVPSEEQPMSVEEAVPSYFNHEQPVLSEEEPISSPEEAVFSHEETIFEVEGTVSNQVPMSNGTRKELETHVAITGDDEYTGDNENRPLVVPGTDIQENKTVLTTDSGTQTILTFEPFISMSVIEEAILSAPTNNSGLEVNHQNSVSPCIKVKKSPQPTIADYIIPVKRKKRLVRQPQPGTSSSHGYQPVPLFATSDFPESLRSQGYHPVPLIPERDLQESMNCTRTANDEQSMYLNETGTREWRLTVTFLKNLYLNGDQDRSNTN